MNSIGAEFTRDLEVYLRLLLLRPQCKVWSALFLDRRGESKKPREACTLRGRISQVPLTNVDYAR